MFTILILTVIAGAITYETLRPERERPEPGPDLTALLRLIEEHRARLRTFTTPELNTLPTWATRGIRPQTWATQ